MGSEAALGPTATARDLALTKVLSALQQQLEITLLASGVLTSWVAVQCFFGFVGIVPVRASSPVPVRLEGRRRG